MNILAIGAHFDDIELGCGGTLARHAAKGDKVTAFVATRSGFSDPSAKAIRSDASALSEGEKALSLLGAKLVCGGFKTFRVEFGEKLNRKILSIIEKEKIERVYTHWSQDSHHDHRAVSLASLHCAKHVPQVLMYRSNWYKTAAQFKGNFYSDISAFLARKDAAIRCHRSEMKRTGGKWLRYYRCEAEKAGIEAGLKYAEVFEALKWTER
jgi:LmbE family N-acetylglucosaminyl deacetylase